MFRHLPRSHRELPIRFADFGVLHRNEESGALKGLTRVRRFQQDDAHIFCKESDIGSEIRNQLEFMKRVYGIFGYKFALELSTRPDNYLGELPVWDKAEAALERSLTEFGHPWTKDIGGGAFYGPKIDVKIQVRRKKKKFQCAQIVVKKKEFRILWADLISVQPFSLTFSFPFDSSWSMLVLRRTLLNAPSLFTEPFMVKKKKKKVVLPFFSFLCE